MSHLRRQPRRDRAELRVRRLVGQPQLLRLAAATCTTTWASSRPTAAPIRCTTTPSSTRASPTSRTSSTPTAASRLIFGTSDQRFQIPNVSRTAACNRPALGLDRATARPTSRARTSTRTSTRPPSTASSATCTRPSRFTSQVSLFARYSTLKFTPDPTVGDILYNGISQIAAKTDIGRRRAGRGRLRPERRAHAARRGDRRGRPLDQRHDLAGAAARRRRPATCQSSATSRFTIVDNGAKTAETYSVYLQDEWKLADGADAELRPALRPVQRLPQTRTRSARG